MDNSKSNIAKAIIAVMKKVKGIDKTMTVGSGANSYKGVPDQEVKKVIGDAMAEHGLCLLPISVDAKTTVERWEETNQYGTKQKQSVFTEAHTKYLLLHESGESIELSGYGHGVDSQDKGAGKATTYALKYTMLYSFLVPTGKIDDADSYHSNDYEQPQKRVAPAAKKQAIKDKPFGEAIDRIKKGELGLYQKMLDSFDLTAKQVEELETTFAESNIAA